MIRFLLAMIALIEILFITPILIYADQAGNGDGVTQACPCGYDGAGTLCWECPADPACTSNAQCGGGVCCQGQCVGTGECGGGSAAECWNGTVDCPAGSTVAWNQPINTFCKKNDWGTMCEPIGGAQKNSGCCLEVCDPDNDQDCRCANGQVTTYNCCPPGTADTCDLVDRNTNIQIQRDYNTRFQCEDDYDTFVSTVQNNNIKSGPLKICDGDWVYNEKKGKDECTGEVYWYTEYYYTTTCRDIDRVCTCQSVCNNTQPTNLSVVQGSSATSANVSWTVGTGGVSQRLYVDQSQTEVNNGCTTPNACEVNATLAAGTNSYIVTGLLPATTYYFRVTNYLNSSCNLGVVSSYTTPNVNLSGRVYLDNNNNCSTTTPWSFGGLTVSVPGTAYSGTVGSDGRFGFYGGVNTPISLLLSGYDGSYVPSTAAGCNAGALLTSVINPSSTNYFYLTPKREAWWQAVGASVYAGGNVRSELPTASLKLIETGAGGAVGALMRSTGTVDTGAGAVSSEGYSAQTRYRGKTMNYDYFAAHMGVTPNTVNDWAADTMNKPANNPSKVFYYHNPSGSEASVSNPWVVAAGESYVIFVNGDLRIASNITVADGGFLAFIVNGSVRVSPAVTDVAGLYVIDSTLITESNEGTDVAVNFQGSVVAWGGVNLGRDLAAGNLNQAGEKFTYRADLLNNMPDSMKVFALRWEEVVPGTFGQ